MFSWFFDLAETYCFFPSISNRNKERIKTIGNMSDDRVVEDLQLIKLLKREWMASSRRLHFILQPPD
jgi:hypothetical protein